MAETAAMTDLLPLDELAKRLRLNPKTLKRLHREEALPLLRFTDGGSYFGFWSEVEEWARKRPRV